MNLLLKKLLKEYELLYCEGNFTSTITLNFNNWFQKLTISPFVLCHAAISGMVFLGDLELQFNIMYLQGEMINYTYSY